MLRHSCNASPASLYQLVRRISLRQLTASLSCASPSVWWRKKRLIGD